MGFELKKVSDFVHEIAIDPSRNMKVPVRIYANENIINSIGKDRTLMQAVNAASLPGIVSSMLVMPDGHEGYSFPIGGVAAFDAQNGIISPGAIGFDINCGVRLIKTDLKESDVRPRLPQLMDRLFANVPSGVGSKISLGFTRGDLEKVAIEGVPYIISKGFGFSDDVDRTEENGSMKGADPDKVSDLAKKRGVSQLGTLGAGNHFLEVQKVEHVLDENIAKAFALEKDQIVIMLHSGSRGYGHQVCSDYLRTFEEYRAKEHIALPDPELLYAYTGSKEADNYLAAMRSAVNFAFVNRQIMTHLVRKSFTEVFGKSADALGMELVYDVAHNIAKLEEHVVDGKRMKLYVHRKGATRAFGPGNEAVPKIYRAVGQPVIIPGSMGTASYVLAGRQEAMEESFGSSCHGSGRLMSRHQAIRDIPASKTMSDLQSKHVEFRVRSRKLISEEAAWAYKNVDDVVASVAGAKISNIVARLVPLGVAKG
ncbi:MAG: RtcB family protein [Candidatus Marsarchaeota archaeon]|nr:RtcB family protein [Candidatus Marsarchaeota archaeon]